jgi:hypothetical protein
MSKAAFSTISESQATFGTVVGFPAAFGKIIRITGSLKVLSSERDPA